MVEWLQTYGLSPEAILRWVAAGGSAVAANIILSWLAEKFRWFQERTAQEKKFFIYFFSGLLSMGAWATLTYVPAEVFAAILPWLAAFVTGIIGAATTATAHAVRKVLSVRQ